LNNKDLWIVPVDTPDRGLHLNALAKRLDTDLKTDWQPVGCGKRNKAEYINLSAIYELQVVKQFY